MILLRSAFLLIVSLLFIVAQLFFSLWGITLPFVSVLIFYAAYVYGNRCGITLAVLCGMMLDFCSGWPLPWSIPFLLIPVYLGRYWLRRVESQAFLIFAIPGFLMPFFCSFLPGVPAGGFSIQKNLELFTDAAAASVFFACLTPLLILVINFFSGRLELGKLADAKERMLRKQA